MENKPAWRSLLSIGIILFAVIRIALTCSRSSESSYTESPEYQRLTNGLREGALRKQRKEKTASKHLFYESYDSIRKLTPEERKRFGVTETEKDSLVPLELSAKIKVEKNSFIQKNYDDTLSIAVKFPDDTSLFMHSYGGSGALMDNFKSVKKGRELENISFTVNKPDSKFLSYRYTVNGKKCNGIAMMGKENNRFTFIEFESGDLPKEALELKAVTALAGMAK